MLNNFGYIRKMLMRELHGLSTREQYQTAISSHKIKKLITALLIISALITNHN